MAESTRCPNPPIEVRSPSAFRPVLNPMTMEREPTAFACSSCGRVAKVVSVEGFTVRLRDHIARIRSGSRS